MIAQKPVVLQLASCAAPCSECSGLAAGGASGRCIYERCAWQCTLTTRLTAPNLQGSGTCIQSLGLCALLQDAPLLTCHPRNMNARAWSMPVMGVYLDSEVAGRVAVAHHSRDCTVLCVVEQGESISPNSWQDKHMQINLEACQLNLNTSFLHSRGQPRPLTGAA